MVKRMCLGVNGQRCNRLTDGSRCPDCQRAVDAVYDARKRAKRPDLNSAEERRRRAATVTAWREEHGDWCPGWQREPHPSADLTADHVYAVGAGAPEGGPMSVLCRSCNGRRGSRARFATPD